MSTFHYIGFLLMLVGALTFAVGALMYYIGGLNKRIALLEDRTIMREHLLPRHFANYRNATAR